jgi:hypothetical protein
MSLATEDKDLTTPAARLAMAAPNEWKAFLAAFKAYSDGKRDQLVASTLEELQRAQGRAQGISSLHGTLSNAVEDANKVADRKSAAALRFPPQPARADYKPRTRTWSE